MRVVIIMIAIHSLHVFGNPTVNLTLETETIKFGEPLILTCTVHGISKINTDITRQFSKGKNGDLLCFNGHITQTRKYEEILSEGNTFSLKINNVTESDVNSIYHCRYEFSTVKQIIKINEMNFEYGPTENTTVIAFNEYDNKSFEIQINFTKIFPVPKCSADLKTEQLKFSNTSVLEEGMFYKVSFLLKYAVNFQCGTDLKVYCKVGRSNYHIKTFKSSMNCPSHSFSMIISTISTCAFTVLAVVIVSLSFVIVYKKRKLNKWRRGVGKSKVKNEKQEQETFVCIDM